MINKIIEACAHNKFIVLLFVGMATLAGLWSIKNITLDAIPDLSDTQVIIYSRWDRSPDIMEDQVTYPIISSLLGVPKVKDIRGFSDFGYSYVYIIFEDGTDIYCIPSATRLDAHHSCTESRCPHSTAFRSAGVISSFPSIILTSVTKFIDRRSGHGNYHSRGFARTQNPPG